MPTTSEPERFLRLPEVQARTGISCSGIYALIDAGMFPPQVPLSARRVGWRETDITKWQRERIAARDRPARRRRHSEAAE